MEYLPEKPLVKMQIPGHLTQGHWTLTHREELRTPTGNRSPGDLKSVKACRASLPQGLNGKDLPEVYKTRVRFLGQEDPLEEGIASPSSILAWEIPWTEEPGRPQSGGGGSQEVGYE